MVFPTNICRVAEYVILTELGSLTFCESILRLVGDPLRAKFVPQPGLSSGALAPQGSSRSRAKRLLEGQRLGRTRQ